MQPAERWISIGVAIRPHAQESQTRDTAFKISPVIYFIAKNSRIITQCILSQSCKSASRFVDISGRGAVPSLTRLPSYSEQGSVANKIVINYFIIFIASSDAGILQLVDKR